MLTDWLPFQSLAKAFAEGQPRLSVAGLAGAARSLAVAELLLAHPRPALVLTAGLADARRVALDLKFFGAPAVEFPEAEPHLWRGGRQREADAVVKISCTRTATGNHARSHTSGGCRYRIKKRITIGSARKKCTMFASTLTMGRTSAGKSTFLIRLPPAISEPEASVSEAANQVHGRMPHNMNSA